MVGVLLVVELHSFLGMPYEYIGSIVAVYDTAILCSSLAEGVSVTGVVIQRKKKKNSKDGKI